MERVLGWRVSYQPVPSPSALSLLAGGGRKTDRPHLDRMGPEGQDSQKEGTKQGLAVFPGFDGISEALRPLPIPHWTRHSLLPANRCSSGRTDPDVSESHLIQTVLKGKW